MQLPFKGQIKITTLYGEKGNWACGWHTGVDLVALEDKNVYAIAPGKVEYVRDGGAYGKHIRVLHNNGMVSLYAHLASIEVKKWDEVSCNTVLGIEGSSGNSSGKHLHLEVHHGSYLYPAQNSKPADHPTLLDPCKVLRIKNQKGKVIKLKDIKNCKEAINHLAKLGVINDPDYWLMVAQTTKNFDLLMVKIANSVIA